MPKGLKAKKKFCVGETSEKFEKKLQNTKYQERVNATFMTYRDGTNLPGILTREDKNND